MSSDDRAARLEGLLTQHAWVRALARTLVRSDADADDLAQEAWLAAARSPPDGRGSVRGWFGTVLRNASRQVHRGEVRRERREDAAARPEAQASAHDIVGRAEEHRRVVDAVLALDEPSRTTILLRFFDELPPRDVAARMGVPVETVRARIRRALERLRERLDETHGGDGAAWRLALLPLAGLRPEWITTTAAGAAGAKSGTAAGTATATTSSFLTGAITMATTTTVAVGVIALVAGATVAWLAGAGGRADLAKARDEVASAQAAAESARTEATSARETAQRRDGRITELEGELRKEREALREVKARAEVLSADLLVARDDLAKARPGGAPAKPAGPPIVFAEFAETFGQVNWDSVAEHTTAMVGPTREIVDAILAGQPVPLKAAGEAQRHNGPLIQAVSAVAGKIPGTGVNGAYTHPAFQVNAMVVALERIGKPATGEQRTSLEGIGRRFSEEERKRDGSYGETTFQMQRLVEEGALKDRFFNEVRAVLTTDQLDSLSPPQVRDRTSADLWSEGLFWAQFARPVKFVRKEQVTESAARIFGASLKLDDAQKTKAAAIVADWTAGLPADLMERKLDAIEAIGMFPADLVAKAAGATRKLVERLAAELPLAGDQLAAARRFGVVLYPFPNAGDDE